MSRFLSPAFVCIVLFCAPVVAQHLPDTSYKTVVEHPAYEKSSPRVMFDEAHNNFHTATGRYKPFADLLMNDGYRLVINRLPFTKKSLESFKLLVIANALAADIDEPDADKPAFSEEECGVLRDWVKSGGSLLLVADPGPFGRSAAGLAKQFGVEMEGNVTEDPSHSVEEFRPTLIIYSRDNHQLLEHPITTGRDAAERIQRVVVFDGQSLKASPDAAVLLKLADSARDVKRDADGEATSASSAMGKAQGVALKFGSGRVVVLAEADMLSALLGGPPDNEPIGMNYPGVDNKQLTLNVMHWLSGLLK
ncbi:MAG TPA: hypothetical protein VLE19_08965 [Pyrinomonadaceae bacterium]|nr:hypothetical protein [Pyrinomonadaceae bacterium]